MTRLCKAALVIRFFPGVYHAFLGGESRLITRRIAFASRTAAVGAHPFDTAVTLL